MENMNPRGREKRQCAKSDRGSRSPIVFMNGTRIKKAHLYISHIAEHFNDGRTGGRRGILSPNYLVNVL